jgi:CrcB protein
MERFLCVCLGGAIGSGCRYLVSLWALERLGSGFPYGTLIVNALGSFLLGALLQLTTLPPTLRITLAVGVLGGFTTYSSFNQETLVLAQQQSYALAAANVLGTVTLCLCAGWLGQAAVHGVIGR